MHPANKLSYTANLKPKQFIKDNKVVFKVTFMIMITYDFKHTRATGVALKVKDRVK
jgi:hypothetical protein